MGKSSDLKTLLKWTAIIFLLQGIAWIILTLVCFMYYTEAIPMESIPLLSYSKLLKESLFEEYLLQDYVHHPISKIVQIITPKGFMGLCGFYFVLSIIWVTFSSLVLYLMDNVRKVSCIFIFWTAIGFVVCLADLVFTSILAQDFKIMTEDIYSITGDNYRNRGFIYITATGIVMTIVARGYLLWIINLVLNIVALMMILKNRDRKSENFSRTLRDLMRRKPQQTSSIISRSDAVRASSYQASSIPPSRAPRASSVGAAGTTVASFSHHHGYPASNSYDPYSQSPNQQQQYGQYRPSTMGPIPRSSIPQSYAPRPSSLGGVPTINEDITRSPRQSGTARFNPPPPAHLRRQRQRAPAPPVPGVVNPQHQRYL